jgi:endonuclease-3 related protein
MNYKELYYNLKDNYKSLDPHHDTWILWTKDNKTTEEIFEVLIGSILIQNTNWKNVDQAIENLRKNKCFSFESLLNCTDEQLIQFIRPAGFFNQKLVYIKNISEFMLKNDESLITREMLLKIKGIGKETADSILNFCLRKPIPVIGAYTKRFFARFYGDEKYLTKKYEFIQEEIIPYFNNSSASILGLFHALIVVHSQNVCFKRKPNCQNCIIKNYCFYFNSKEKNSNLYKIIDQKINPTKKNKFE